MLSINRPSTEFSINRDKMDMKIENIVLRNLINVRKLDFGMWRNVNFGTLVPKHKKEHIKRDIS